MLSHRSLYTIPKIGQIDGVLDVPGDKSLSHRILILGALTRRLVHVRRCNMGDDVLKTLKALKQLGVCILRFDKQKGDVSFFLREWKRPSFPIECGNSGTSARFLIGLLSQMPFDTCLVGDESLSKRPMKRLTELLCELLGCRFEHIKKDGLPLKIFPSEMSAKVGFAQERIYHLKIASAQVKSAILLASLFHKGKTIITESLETRPHTEELLRLLGAPIRALKGSQGENIVCLDGTSDKTPLEIWCEALDKQRINEFEYTVPGDPSAAAFPVVATLITPKSSLTISSVSASPHRFAYINVLKEMRGFIEISPHAESETIVDIRVQYSKLKSVFTGSELSVQLIDEYPALCVAAFYAMGQSFFEGLTELRYKESDRLYAIWRILSYFGEKCADIKDDTLVISPCSHKSTSSFSPLVIDPGLDHRIAMMVCVLGARDQRQVCLSNHQTISTSFPDFLDWLRRQSVESIDLIPV